MPDNLSLKLISQKKLNETNVHFKFEILTNQPLKLIAGQFLRLLFKQDGEEVFRSYSIANVLNNNEDTITTVELAVSWVKGGLATARLSSMKTGDQIEASAPYGRFCLTDKMWRRYFMVATGTGVTPYRAMQNELISRINDGAEVNIIMGARDASGLLYSNEFRELATKPGYNYITCLSRAKLDSPDILDFQGHVQLYLGSVDFNPENDVAYLCGNPEMVDESFTLLKAAGLPVSQIRREKYVSPPIRKKKAAFSIKN